MQVGGRLGTATLRLVVPPFTSMLGALAWVSRDLRRRGGVTRVEIARIAGVSLSTVERFERGRAWPRDPEQLVDAYAGVAHVRSWEVWRRALDAWAP